MDLKMNKGANPQGKGLVPVLDNLMSLRPSIASIEPKTVEQISHELFTSLFVLGSQFMFRPVPGINYYLYYAKAKFKLSLIAPHEWQNTSFGDYVGCAKLLDDASWTLAIPESVKQHAELSGLINDFKKQFEQQLEKENDIRSLFPRYSVSLPYYQRMLAAAVSFSLGASLDRQQQLTSETQSFLE